MDYILENNNVVLEHVRFNDAPGLMISDVYWQQLHGPRSERTVEEELLKLTKTVQVISIPCVLVSYGEWYMTKV
jgi:hypothetical protein